MNPCDLVIERVALGEPLGELSDHVTSCARCQRIVAMPGKLGATRHASEPGHGFAARMTVGAQHLMVVRRRRRLAAGLAATVAAGVLGVFVVTRSPDEPQHRAAIELPSPSKDNQPVAADEADLDMLVRLADTRRARRVSAPWGRIQKPLKPYMQLVKGVTQ